MWPPRPGLACLHVQAHPQASSEGPKAQGQPPSEAQRRPLSHSPPIDDLADPSGAAVPAPAPEAWRDPTVDVVHGVEVPDPYRWLEDGEAPETREWVEASNAHLGAVLDADPGREALVERYAALFSAGTAGAPSIRGGRLFSIDPRSAQAALVVRDLHGDCVPPQARSSIPMP